MCILTHPVTSSDTQPAAVGSAVGIGVPEYKGGRPPRAVFLRPQHGNALWAGRAGGLRPYRFLCTGTPTCTVPPTRLASGSGNDHPLQRSMTMLKPSRAHCLAQFPDCCIETPLRKGRDGYGRINIRYNGKRISASVHRLAYSLFVAPVRFGEVVMHTCDNPACCNPRHLVIGSAADNIADAASKERIRQGKTHPRAKLDHGKVTLVRGSATAHRQLAQQFGVGESAIRQVRANRTWKIGGAK